jgi:hypothetical protein
VGKTELELLLSKYNWWMGAATIAVAIGILGEYAVHFIFEKEVRRKTLESSARIFFGLLVFGGVVGEYVFGEKLSEVANKIQRTADNEVASLYREASEARKDAAIARKETASFQRDIASANAHAAEASEKAERERLARLKIEAKLAPRSLTGKDQFGIIEKIKPLGPQRIDIFMYPSDAEILDIADQIAGTLNAAEWSIAAFSPLGPGDVSGMRIEYDPKDEAATKRASMLVSALVACRLNVHGPFPSLPRSPGGHVSYRDEKVGATIRLTIGKK